MADTKLTGLTATTTPVLTDYGYIVTTPGGTPASHYVTLDVLQQILSVKNVADGRLTLETGVPISTSDQANKTTLYYTFYKGNKIGLYDGTSWHVRTFAELSIAVGALTASKPYDVFIYDNSGTPALELLVWTNDTTRATALAYQDGVLVKSGAATRRYVGTIYIDSGQKCQDTLAFRYVWNYYNRVGRHLKKEDSTSHTNLSTSTWRSWNNDATIRVTFVQGVQEDVIPLLCNVEIWAGAGSYLAVRAGLGVDVTNTNTIGYFAPQADSGETRIAAGLSGICSVAAGLHFIQAVEWSNNNANAMQSFFIGGIIQA